MAEKGQEKERKPIGQLAKAYVVWAWLHAKYWGRRLALARLDPIAEFFQQPLPGVILQTLRLAAAGILAWLMYQNGTQKLADNPVTVAITAFLLLAPIF